MTAADGRRPQPEEQFVAFASAGTRRVGEFRCTECGYGIISRAALPACPMCQGKAWEESSWRPSGRRR